MTPRIENRSYAYLGNNVVSISATLNVYAGAAVVASTIISASYNLAQSDFVAEVTRQLNERVAAYMCKLLELDAIRQAIFPTSTDFTSAVDQIFDPIQSAIGGV